MRVLRADITLCNGNLASMYVRSGHVYLRMHPEERVAHPGVQDADTRGADAIAINDTSGCSLRFSTLQGSQVAAEVMARYGGCRQKDCLRVLRAALPESIQP